MRVISEDAPGDVFDELLLGARHSALHLEVQQDYDLGEEAEPLRIWRETGQIIETDADREWTALVRETVARGVTVARLRVVTVPHSPYTDWLVATSADNITAGEHIRWLPRHHVVGELPADDWWMLDRTTLALVGFHNHTYTGLAVITDPTLVEVCARAWDRLWQQGIDHDAYTGRRHDTG